MGLFDPKPIKILSKELDAARIAFMMASELPEAHQQQIAATASADVPAAAAAAARAGHKDAASSLLRGQDAASTVTAAGVTWGSVVQAAITAAESA